MLARGTSGPISPQAMIPPSIVPHDSKVRATSSRTSDGEPKGRTACRSMSVRTARVIISRSGDGPTDARRVGEVHQALSTCPGPDKFCFIVMARGSALQLDFPNDSTTLNDELIAYLKSMPGVESVQVSLV